MPCPRIIDGGLATALEAGGHVLPPRLWSAGVFLDAPEAVEQVHLAFLEAGAEILIGASYQMSYDGLAREGLDRPAADEALRRTVAVARRAAAQAESPATVAASIGPYGATLADGSEYSGAYDIGRSGLEAFHRDRLATLSAAAPDLLAIETIPSIVEARVLRRLLDERDGPSAWVSFSCRDASQLNDGTPAAEAAALFDDCRRVSAVGVNCTAPEYVDGLIEALMNGTSKHIVVYPNSGERWNAKKRCWSGQASSSRFVELARGWAARGAWGIGGCCRVGPRTIRALASALGR